MIGDDRQRFAVVGFLPARAAQRDVGGRAHDRDRRPQLVGRVRHELALRLERRCDRAQADRGEPETAGCRAHQRDGNPDEHRFLHLVLFAPDVGERARGKQHERGGFEVCVLCVDTPRARRGRGVPDGATGWRRRREIVQLEAVPGCRERHTARVEHRHGPAGYRERLDDVFGRSRRRTLLLQLVANEVGQRRREAVELAIDAAHAEPALHPQDVGAEQAEHDDEDERVPQRQLRTKRERTHQASGLMTS